MRKAVGGDEIDSVTGTTIGGDGRRGGQWTVTQTVSRTVK